LKPDSSTIASLWAIVNLQEAPVRTKTQQQADKMLDAASRLFGSQRFHEVRMEDIAAEAAVGKGTIYRYFSDKEELYLALLERASSQVVSRIQHALRNSGGSRRQLQAIVRALIEFFDEHPHIFDLIQRAEVLQCRGGDFPWQKARDELMRIVGDVLADGVREGAFWIPDPELAVLLLLGGLRAVIRFGRRPRRLDLAEQIVDQFLGTASPAWRKKAQFAEATH
jgi:AcrR family transcriptional regulator